MNDFAENMNNAPANEQVLVLAGLLAMPLGLWLLGVYIAMGVSEWRASRSRAK